ncbi:oxidoreductase [Propionispora hippei]|uniref:NAD(P)-dependent dehydrogenase, short-chain alcohol dehydrogenase family n=1 Tax=Propionispora hippei DSM 15287 TaxID=1123003 RepID=A0A1M6E0A3_9FIRM|nr:oxidoreductase [Propionispora hippei]SHI78698.1 NAD(P)-dependent dehydrogenase, short-chain alcohol dehydrogenase family [Propionispora hippei DSM 15287]
MEYTKQVPINSGFGPQTTAKEILKGCDLTGKIAIVTGGYSGIGLETTRALANAGATVIVPARSPEKSLKALEGIPHVELEKTDLMDSTSIDDFAARFLATNRPLHLLINSAGVMFTPLRRDSRGFESQFSTNHLGHFQLTARLWPALVRAHGARVVALSSRGHRLGGVDFADPNFENKEYNKFTAYAQSKSANSLFALELDKRGRDYAVRAFAVHPGLVPDTDLGRDLDPSELKPQPVKNSQGLITSDETNAQYKSVEQGAATSVWCATSAQLDDMGGVYCEDCDIAITVASDSTSPFGVRPWAIDAQLAQRLWALSEKLIGIKFEI